MKSKKSRARKRRERELAKKGLMNDNQGNFRAIDTFDKSGMVDGYKAGYRLP